MWLSFCCRERPQGHFENMPSTQIQRRRKIKCLSACKQLVNLVKSFYFDVFNIDFWHILRTGLGH